MMLKAATRQLIFSILFCVSFGLQQQLGRRRECCAYSLGEDSSGSVCSHKSGCILRQDDGTIVSSPGLDECRVLQDSKRYGDDSSSKAKCLSEVFDVEKGQKMFGKNLPWGVRPYVLETKGAKSLPAVSVVVDYTTLPWTGLRFRLVNTDVCQSPPDVATNCNPRCVIIKRDKSARTSAASMSFVYDCEVGFYPSETRMTATTSGHTYRLDICTTDEEDFSGFCGSYLFTMPEANQIIRGQHLILVDTASLEKEQKLSLLFPEPLGKNGTFVLVKTDDNSTSIETFKAEKGIGDLEVQLGSHLKVGVYQIVDYDQRVIARFELKHDCWYCLSTTSMVLIFFLINLLLLAVGAYLRYILVKYFTRIDPDNPNGIAEKHVVRRVLLMSSVENRQHVNIILKFTDYLKTNCGISTVYFALDPETGISCQADGDPWKWAQETIAKVSDDEGGHVLIVGPPPRNSNADSPAEIYEGLIDQQAFVSTKVLRELDAKKKVSVAMFSYSDESRLPSVIPDHIKDRKLKLPDDMNKLVSDILQVKKRRLCWCLPIAFIQPKVDRCDLTENSQGVQILSHVKQLKDSVKWFEEPCEHRNGQVVDDEICKLPLMIADEIPDDDKKAKLLAEPAVAFHVQIESKTLSLGSKVFANRDPKDVAEG